jgi:aerobic carbon-monoxide dehydrogenase medium subunit
MKPAPFQYHAPRSIDEAATLLSELGEGAKILAGGQSLIPMLALRLTAFDHLVDIGRIEDLRGIERRNGTLWIGAGTTEAAVGASDDVATGSPLLHRSTPLIGHFQIRNRGTIGGSLAHADPAAEYPAIALALDAEFEAVSTRGARTIPASGFFTGLWTTTLEGDEILSGVRLPVWTGRCGFAVQEFARRHGDFALGGAVIGLEIDGEDRIRRCAMGLIGLGSTPERASAAEAEVTGRGISEVDPAELGAIAMKDLDSIPSDLHGSAAYRRKLGAVMVARAWTAACEEARSA